MINFKQQEEILPSALILLSLVALAATLLYMLLVPPATVTGSASGHAQARRTVQTETKNAIMTAQQAGTAIRPLLWSGNAEQVTAALLAQLTQQCTQDGLQMTSFRPQRAQVLAGVTELPYNLQLTGPYAQVEAVLNVIDATGSKVVLRSVEISPSQGNSGVVTATLGLSTYLAGTSAPQDNTAGGGADNG